MAVHQGNKLSINWKILQRQLEDEESNNPKRCIDDRHAVKRSEHLKPMSKSKRESSTMDISSSSSSQKNRTYAKIASQNPKPQSSQLAARPQQQSNNNNNKQRLSKCIAVDCEYVGIGSDGRDDMLARVSVVNSRSETIYDKFVKPRESVIDFRTAVSGIRPSQLKHGADFSAVQKEVSALLHGKTLIGHAVHNDLRVLGLSHPKRMIRDTAKYPYFRVLCKTRATPSLKKVAQAVLGIEIQQGEHDSVSDARIAMQIYQIHKKEWENSNRTKRKT